MRRNFAVGVVLMLGGVCILFLGVLIPLVTKHTVDWETEFETIPIELTFLAFVLLIFGVGLVAVELATRGLVYTSRKKETSKG